MGTAASGLGEGNPAGLLGPPRFPWDLGIPGLGVPSLYIAHALHTPGPPGEWIRELQGAVHESLPTAKGVWKKMNVSYLLLIHLEP